MKCSRTAVAALIALSTRSALTFGQDGDNMSRLAMDSGCYICHSVEPRDPAREVLAFGPAFKDIARRYKRQTGAVDRLTGTILQGTGSRAPDRHWIGKISGEVMLPNAVELNEADARNLARWILSLDR